ncbi:MAG: hypothetical protein RL138_645, partial [Bacteroidota bacterium]
QPPYLRIRMQGEQENKKAQTYLHLFQIKQKSITLQYKKEF